MASLERQHFWGCTLTKDKPEAEWTAIDEEMDVEVDIMNQLALSSACLGPKAKTGASHVVQVTTTGLNSNKITQPIVVLGDGVRQVPLRLEFSSAATFKLIDGHGPVHLAGNHIQVLSGGDYPSDMESEEESADEGIDSAKQSPLGAKNKVSPSPGKQPPAKRAKIDLSVEDSEDDDDDEDDDEPQLIPMKSATKGQKTPVNKKSPQVDKKTPQNEKKTQEKKKPAQDEKTPQKMETKKGKGMFDEEAEEGSDSDEDDEDFEMGDSDDEDDDDEDDDETDEDEDEEQGDSDDDSSEEEADEEDITKAIAAARKKVVQENGVQNKTPKGKPGAAKTPRGDKTPGAAKTPGGDKKTPKQTNLDASLTLSKTPDIETIKQKLLKSPGLPKKEEKFRNYMKQNMKVSEDKVIRDLWKWVQSTRK